LFTVNVYDFVYKYIKIYVYEYIRKIIDRLDIWKVRNGVLNIS